MSDQRRAIYHFTPRAAYFAEPQRDYLPETFARDGFIHCSEAEQLRDAAARFAGGRSDLVVLTINPDKLRAPLVYEDLFGEGRAFPHLYGPLNRDAVVAVSDFCPDADGVYPAARGQLPIGESDR
ncbi:MAG: DUF952 domain-containing protein [Deltaproteobacteria bacterium]|nr:DUF952 domain-containing protein [Deltaproteobacteria bacterium]